MTASTMETGRRGFLLGLAAAATAAATATATAAATPAENPKLLALAADLPALAEAYHAALRDYREMDQYWVDATPLLPDEMTEVGSSWTQTDLTRGRGSECSVHGGFMRRYGEKFPRRIVLVTWEVERLLSQARSAKRKAKRNGSVVDFVAADEEVKRLKDLLARAEAYDNEFAAKKVEAYADHERLYPIREQAVKALIQRVSEVMSEPDWTMEGLLIKAEALIAWGQVDQGDKIYAHLSGASWHSDIASSIIRHAKVGAV